MLKILFSQLAYVVVPSETQQVIMSETLISRGRIMAIMGHCNWLSTDLLLDSISTEAAFSK